ncbi:MAG TPA: HigA family addiction module antitoxin [Rhodanobacter sp.]
MRRIPYPNPGEILLEEFLKPMGITQYRLAKEIGMPQRRIGEIVAGKRADTGLRLAQFFGTSEGFWTGLQDDHDRATTKEAIEDKLNQRPRKRLGFRTPQQVFDASFNRGALHS